MSSAKDFDVIILGSGMGGTILASILARHEMRVLVLDAGVHPRFAIGESTIPQTSQLHTLLSYEFDVPELDDIGLGSPDKLRKNAGPTSGIKRTFGFAHHELRQEHQPEHGIQFGNVWRDENHLFRQDVDSYLLRVALKHGARIMQQVRVEQVELLDSGATLQTTAGSFTSDYVVDGTGFRSVIAHAHGLRETPARFDHHSRTIFTHMMDVEPFDYCVENPLTVPWSEGTLHHVFDRGWIWVIPFNNWSGATNPLISIGLTVDPRVYPQADGLSPEEEFFQFLERLPSVKRQFRKAKAVRPWVRTGRLQYSSSRSVGERFCLLAHASGFIDPLYSRGLINNAEIIQTLARTLLAAHRDKDYSLPRFEHLENTHRKILDYNDRIVDASFASWADFDLWNAWLRVWAIGTGCVETNLGSHLLMYGVQGQEKALNNALFSPFEDSRYADYFNASHAIITEFKRDELDARNATANLLAVLKDYEFTMVTPDGQLSHYWALKEPNCRDLFLGDKPIRERWANKLADPHL